MKRLKQYRSDLLLPALAIVCTVVSVRAQDFVSLPDDLPSIIGRKQAEELSLSHPAPEYPPVAMVNLVQGNVQLQIIVNSAGIVTSAHVLEGNALLAAAGLQAMSRWIYRPLSTPTGPTGFMTTVKLKFTLRTPPPELSPQRAERDFLRQVKPPQTSLPPEDGSGGESVLMRLLINDQGQVVDKDVPHASGAQFEAAWETVRGWSFRPAYWGNLPIASYLEIKVHVGAPLVTRAAANPVSH